MITWVVRVSCYRFLAQSEVKAKSKLGSSQAVRSYSKTQAEIRSRLPKMSLSKTPGLVALSCRPPAGVSYHTVLPQALDQSLQSALNPQNV